MAKEYNIKAIVDKDELKLLFECDKEKNKQCNKKYCGGDACNHTTDSRYMKAKARQHNKDITDEELICNLESEIEYYRNKLKQIYKDMILINKPNNATQINIDTLCADNAIVQTRINYEYK